MCGVVGYWFFVVRIDSDLEVDGCVLCFWYLFVENVYVVGEY